MTTPTDKFRGVSLALFVAALLALPAAMAQDQIRQYGSVSMTSAGMMGMDQTIVSASFYELPEAVAAPGADGYFQADRIDMCFVSEEGETQQPEPPEAALPFEDATQISAGEPIDINSGGAVYLSLNGGANGYNATTSQPLPESATVDIPGAEDGFPSFSGQAFPQIMPIEFTAPADLQNIDASTTFTWSQTADLGVVTIVMQATTSGGEDAGIVCIAADDGEFSLSGQDALADVTPQAVLLYGRNTVETYVQGDAMLSLNMFSSTLAMQMPSMPSSPQ